MRLNVTMEGPNTRIISLKPQSSPTIREYNCSVPQRRVLQVEFSLITHFEFPLSIPQDPKVMPMQMPRVNLTMCPRQHIGVLQNHINHLVISKHVNPTPNI
uniref:Uncharacterized protein n=1 Tax=Cajanus cajan TaxID=3821 RepID=A0A151U1I6_CAJCA|nr:hypothetical protein KK1_005806 [Cajanus cajan]